MENIYTKNEPRRVHDLKIGAWCVLKFSLCKNTLLCLYTQSVLIRNAAESH